MKSIFLLVFSLFFTICIQAQVSKFTRVENDSIFIFADTIKLTEKQVLISAIKLQSDIIELSKELLEVKNRVAEIEKLIFYRKEQTTELITSLSKVNK